MAKFIVSYRIRALDSPGRPGDYKITNWEGNIVEVKVNPSSNVVMKAHKTGYKITFSENGLEKI